MLQLNVLSNIVGFFSLLGAIAVVFPTINNVLETNKNKTRISFQFSYFSLLATITLGLIHGLWTTQNSNIDFYNLGTYWIYAVGLFSFNLLVFIALTFSELKKDLKKFNYFNYAVLSLLLLHVGQKIIW